MEILYILIELSWGLPQSMLGAVLFCLFINRKHFMYHGAIVTHWPLHGSISLGEFIFVPSFASSRILVHEYGHTIQSLILGPLYLLVIGIPSFLWSIYHDGKGPYTGFYTEKNADWFGTAILKKDSLERKYHQ